MYYCSTIIYHFISLLPFPPPIAKWKFKWWNRMRYCWFLRYLYRMNEMMQRERESRSSREPKNEMKTNESLFLWLAQNTSISNMLTHSHTIRMHLAHMYFLYRFNFVCSLFYSFDAEPISVLLLVLILHWEYAAVHIHKLILLEGIKLPFACGSTRYA